jgi:hypothetical protein
MKALKHKLWENQIFYSIGLVKKLENKEEQI